jgi:hypothetical protein
MNNRLELSSEADQGHRYKHLPSGPEWRLPIVSFQDLVLLTHLAAVVDHPVKLTVLPKTV